VQRALVVPPGGQIGPITADQRAAVIQASPFYGTYEQMIDRESAYEVLKKKTAPHTGDADAEMAGRRAEFERRQAEQEAAAAAEAEAKKTRGRGKPRQSGILVTFVKAAARTTVTTIGGIIKRGLMGTFFGTKRRR
jgi:uncharacterized protein